MCRACKISDMIKWMGLFVAAAGAWAQPLLDGTWQGTLDAGAVKLRLALHISHSGGEYKSTLDSLDQSALGIPVNETTVTGNVLHFEIARLRASYEGTLSTDGNSIRGTFTQGAAMPLELRRVDKIEAPLRPQMPKPPFPYRSEEVKIESGRETLSGTLTSPQGNGPFPAAILITGSGTHDRDETLFGHKPFWVIADYLTQRGIAVLRVDDRPDKAQSTFDDLAKDVLAEVAYLAARKEIDAKEIGLIGHSEGACVGPLAASRSDRVAFVIMLAGVGVDGEEALLQQGELLVRSRGLGDVAVERQRQVQKTLLDIVRQEKDPAIAAEKLRAALEKVAPQTAAAALSAEINKANAPEIRALIHYDGRPVLQSLKMPVLALNGSRDIQVSAEQNLPAIAAALKAGGNRDFKIVEMAGLNHLFQSCKKCTIAEYGELEETISPDVLKLMAAWIQEHTKFSARR